MFGCVCIDCVYVEFLKSVQYIYMNVCMYINIQYICQTSTT